MSTVLLALFDDYEIAERVREVLVQDGFPTDRVEVTASCEMGRASLQPADSPHGKCVQYFRALFESEADRDYPEMLAQRIENGAAAVTVLPRGAIETARATQIIQHAHPADVLGRDLTEHGWEHAAARRDSAWAQHVWLEHSPNDPDCIYCRLFPEQAVKPAPHYSATETGSTFTPAVGLHFAAAPAASIPARTAEFLRIGVRRVRALKSLEWLSRGWDDLWSIRSPSLMHGILIAALGAVLLTLGSSHPYFVVAAVSGYLLFGPIMATGLCELSRRRAAGEPLGFDDSLQGVMRNPQALLKFGAILAAVTFVWFVASEVMLRSVLQLSGPTTGEVLWGGFTETASRAQIIAYVGSGAVLAALVFAVSVVSVPLIIDRQASATEAVWGSLKATLSNIPAMLVWSALIVVLTAFGFLTLLLGMIVVAPLLGHATWHAYRELVE
jgi:uncharacterized membrane protein